MKEFIFESIRDNQKKNISVGDVIHPKFRQGLGNYASLHLNKNGGFFIYLLICFLKDEHIAEFNKNEPEFRIFTKGDKSYILINFAPNLPIFEFLFDISVYKDYISEADLKKIIKNEFNIVLADCKDTIQSIKTTSLNICTYNKLESSLIHAFNNPNFSNEYRVFLIPFYDKSADRWWNIIKE